MTLQLTKTLIPNVTRERIDRASPGCGTCPIAVTLMDRGYGAAVGMSLVTVSLPRGRGFAEYRLPVKAQDLVHDYDWTGDAEPLRFRMTRVS